MVQAKQVKIRERENKKTKGHNKLLNCTHKFFVHVGETSNRKGEKEGKKIQQPHNSLLDEYAGWP